MSKVTVAVVASRTVTVTFSIRNPSVRSVAGSVATVGSLSSVCAAGGSDSCARATTAASSRPHASACSLPIFIRLFILFSFGSQWKCLNYAFARLPSMIIEKDAPMDEAKRRFTALASRVKWQVSV